MKKIPVIILSAVFIMVLTSCDKVPEAEIEQAKAAMENARAAGAETYAPESFLALQDSLDAALALVESQQSKMFKNFDDSRIKLAEVNDMATGVVEESEMTKSVLRQEIETLTNETRLLLEENRQLLLQAPKGKEGAAALEEIKSEIETLDNEVGKATQASQNGDLYPALDMLKASGERLASINAELKNAISKTKGK